MIDEGWSIRARAQRIAFWKYYLQASPSTSTSRLKAQTPVLNLLKVQALISSALSDISRSIYPVNERRFIPSSSPLPPPFSSSRRELIPHSVATRFSVKAYKRQRERQTKREKEEKKKKRAKRFHCRKSALSGMMHLPNSNDRSSARRVSERRTEKPPDEKRAAEGRACRGWGSQKWPASSPP